MKPEGGDKDGNFKFRGTKFTQKTAKEIHRNENFKFLGKLFGKCPSLHQNQNLLAHSPQKWRGHARSGEHLERGVGMGTMRCSVISKI